MRQSLATVGRMQARGTYDAQSAEDLIRIYVSVCPQQQRGDAVDRMLKWIEECRLIEEADRDLAEDEVHAAVKPLLIRERPVSEIRDAAIAANRKWQRDPLGHGVLREGELVQAVREQMLVHRSFQGRRRRCA